MTQGCAEKHRPLAVLLLLSLLATLIYSNTFSSPFHLDDMPNIVENPKIKNLANFLDFSGTRYAGFLSFALNYHFGGLNVFGYHLLNLLIHITNGFLVYSLVLLLVSIRLAPAKPDASAQIGGRSCTPPDTPHRTSPLASAPWIALATALLFIAHPIQTQAVTYIVQRFASLVTLFYLLGVVCYLKWRLASPDERGRYLWYGAALLSTLLAMKTKENSFTLPFMILLVEGVFFRSVNKRRWVALLPFLLITLPIIPFSLGDVLGEAEGFARDTTEISRLDYFFTQFRVIVTYLRLLVLPVNQNLDYDYPIYHSLSHPAVFLSFLFLLSLAGFALLSLFRPRLSTHHPRLRLIAFGILWFFLTLSIESSIIPITDVIFEHRIYLPSVGFFLSACVALRLGMGRVRYSFRGKVIGLLPVGMIVLLLGMATYQRNQIWQDGVTLWKDVVRKAPDKVRPRNNLGNAYKDIGRLEEAKREYLTALRLDPSIPATHYNLGAAYSDQGHLEEAIREYRTALRLQPIYAEAHYNLGDAYVKQGDLDLAIQEYRTALKLKPDYADAHYNLGVVYADQGRLEEATKEYEVALRLQPDLINAHHNLGTAYAAQGRWEAALQEYQAALKLRPDDAEMHYNLGTVHAAQGRWEAAIQEYQAVLRLNPDYADAHNNLGNVYVAQGSWEAAIQEYQAALRLRPDDAEVRNNLDNAYRHKDGVK